MAYRESLFGDSRPEDFRQIFQAIMQTNERLMEQNRSLLALLSTTDQSRENLESQDRTRVGDRERRSNIPTSPVVTRVDSEVWRDILGANHNDCDDFMQSFHNWARPASLEDVLKGRRAWTSWSYKASFPDLSAFLERASLDESCPCQVSVEDYRSSIGDPITVSFSKANRRVKKLWEDIKDRPLPVTSLPVASQGTAEVTNLAKALSARLFRIIDLSPIVLACILGSTPQVDLSYIAAFLERHLELSNWGRVSLLKYRDMSWSSYTFEYHFSFYYVTPEYAEADSVKLDRRRWRKSAPFGKEMASRTRYIHEECLSFLLIGHFKDVTTCIQLAESYFKYDPYSRKMESHSFRPYILDQSPALMLLSWISVGLHHVSWRWQSAIEAVDREIKSSAQVIFMADRKDLMADDPEFSLSKTYFWALQAYKLFEKTLLDTIGTWRSFKERSLPKLRDGRIDPETWHMSIQDIDVAVDGLEKKVARIRASMAEVKDLRTGLVSASALFDSRTSVRQGENIRTLTYITILFFPLSFVTSIFGMQLNGTDSVKAFAILLPTFTFAAALLVFNLENIISIWSIATENLTVWFRKCMRNHRREDWKKHAIALHEDQAARKAPVTEARRKSTAWVYPIFLLEYAFVTLPIYEIMAFLRFVGILTQELDREPDNRASILMAGDDETLDSVTARRMFTRKQVEEKINKSLQEEAERKRKKREKERGPFLGALAKIGTALFTTAKVSLRFTFSVLRSLFLPLWLVLLAIEYLILALYLSLTSLSLRTPHSDDPLALLSAQDSEEAPESIWKQTWGCLGLDILLPPQRTPHDVEDPGISILRRVATQLSIATPRIGTSSPNRANPVPPSASQTPLRAEYAEDMIRLPLSTNVVTRRVERGSRFARSGLNSELGLGDTEMEMNAALY